MITRQLKQAVVKLELRDHEETLLDGKLLHFLSLGELATGDGS